MVFPGSNTEVDGAKDANCELIEQEEITKFFTNFQPINKTYLTPRGPFDPSSELYRILPPQYSLQHTVLPHQRRKNRNVGALSNPVSLIRSFWVLALKRPILNCWATLTRWCLLDITMVIISRAVTFINGNFQPARSAMSQGKKSINIRSYLKKYLFLWYRLSLMAGQPSWFGISLINTQKKCYLRRSEETIEWKLISFIFPSTITTPVTSVTPLSTSSILSLFLISTRSLMVEDGIDLIVKRFVNWLMPGFKALLILWIISKILQEISWEVEPSVKLRIKKQSSRLNLIRVPLKTSLKFLTSKKLRILLDFFQSFKSLKINGANALQI